MKRLHDAVDKALAEANELRMRRGIKSISQEEIDAVSRALDPVVDTLEVFQGDNGNLKLAIALLEVADTCAATD